MSDTTFSAVSVNFLFSLVLATLVGVWLVSQKPKTCEVRIALSPNKMESHWVVAPCKEVE